MQLCCIKQKNTTFGTHKCSIVSTMLKTAQHQSDWLGAAASGLCLIHCVITPFIFVAQACSATCCHSSPWWWSAIDGLFLVISWAAIRWSVRETSLNWIPAALYGTWGALVAVMINDKAGGVALGALAYVPALVLVGLHLYNRRYCQCENTACQASGCSSISDQQ